MFVAARLVVAAIIFGLFAVLFDYPAWLVAGIGTFLLVVLGRVLFVARAERHR